jgi:hypothetical protein
MTFYISSSTMATESESDKTFHPFPQLPTELRLLVWAYALPSTFTHPSPSGLILTAIERVKTLLVSLNRIPRSTRRLPLQLQSASPSHILRQSRVTERSSSHRWRRLVLTPLRKPGYPHGSGSESGRQHLPESGQSGLGIVLPLLR